MSNIGKKVWCSTLHTIHYGRIIKELIENDEDPKENVHILTVKYQEGERYAAQPCDIARVYFTQAEAIEAVLRDMEKEIERAKKNAEFWIKKIKEMSNGSSF